MKYIKIVIAILLSLINVLLSSRTLDSNFNPMTFLGFILYVYHANGYVFISATYILQSFITFALFSFFFTKKIVNKQTIVYIILMIIPLLYLYYNSKWILNPFSEITIKKIDLFCGYSGATASLVIYLIFQIIHQFIIIIALTKIKHRYPDKYIF